MKANARHVLVTLLLVSAAAGASAEYRCQRPPSAIDARACEAASQGPEALRYFIQRMRVIESLYFNDYVSRETLLAWEAKAAKEFVAKQDQSARPPAVNVAR